MDQSELNLQDLLRVLLRRRTAAVLVFILIFVAVVLVTLTTTPVYQASCDLLISRVSPGGVEVLSEDAIYNYRAAMEFYPTQYEIIRSGTVARKVVDDLALMEDPQFNPLLREKDLGVGDTVRGTLKRILGREQAAKKSPAELEPDIKDGIVSVIQGGLSVESVKNSQVTRLSFQSANPELAAAIANGVARAYIDTTMDMKMGSSREAVRWLTQKLDEQRKKLDRSEKLLQEYTKKHDIVSIENRSDIMTRRMQEINVQLVEAETRTREFEALARQVRATLDDPRRAELIPVVSNDSSIQTLRSEEMELAKNMDELAQKYGPKHPLMIRVHADLASLRSRKLLEIKRVAASVEKDLELARAKEASIRDLLREAKVEGIELSERYIQYNVFNRDVLSNQQIYDALLQRFNRTSLTENIGTSNVTVLEKAKAPRFPIKPNKGKSLLLAILLACCSGIGSAFLLDYLDNTIKNPDHVEQRLGIPLLGVVPALGTTKTGDSIENIIQRDPKSVTAEAYRSIRTALLLTSPSEPSEHKTILVTSFVEQEGKTTTAANLAYVMAQAGKRVLLIDGDMRRPRVHKLFGLKNARGVSTILAGIDDRAQVEATPTKNLWVLPSGPHPPNPSELLTSKRARSLLDTVHAKFDFIIIDSPPTVVTDASLLAQLVDSVVLVIGSGKTTFRNAAQAIKVLGSGSANIGGAILNAVDLKKSSYGNYYYYSYERGYYGEETKDQKSPGV